MWICTIHTKNTGDFQARKGSELSEPAGACHLTSQIQRETPIPCGMTHSLGVPVVSDGEG